MTEPKCICCVLMFAAIIDMMETRTISEQLRLKLCKNLKTMSLGQNLLVFVGKKKRLHGTVSL